MEFDRRLENVFRDVLGQEDIVLTDDLTPNDIAAWDSLNHINLMLTIEEEFGIKIPMADYERLLSVGSIRRRLHAMVGTRTT